MQPKDVRVAKTGGFAALSAGPVRLRIGPGLGEHRYVAIRGGQPPLEGPSFFITGITSLDHTIEFKANL